MERHVAPKLPYQCEPKPCKNTQESNPHLSVLLIQICTKSKERKEKTITLQRFVPRLYTLSTWRTFLFLLTQQPPVGQGLLIHEASKSHKRRTTVRRTPLNGWLVRGRDLYLSTHNTHMRQTSIPPLELEPTVSAAELHFKTARPLGPARKNIRLQ